MKLIRYILVLVTLLSCSVVGQSPATQSPASHNKQRVEQNVKDYGARSDTTVNLYTALNLAQLALPDSGGTITIPSGTYKLNTKLNITKPNTVLKAIGGGAIIYMDSSLNAACSINADYVTIEGITWKTNDTGSSAYFGFIHDSGNVGTTIRNNTFIGGGRQVRVVDVDKFIYDGNTHISVTDHAAPLSLWDVNGFQIINNHIEGLVFPAVPSGGSPPRIFYVQNSSNGLIAGNVIKHCQFSVGDGGAGISLGYYSHHITVMNNVVCSLKFGDGLLVEEGAYSSTFMGNTSSWNDYYDTSATAQGDGIDIFNAHDILVVGNIFDNNGLNESNGHPGVEIWGSSDIRVSGNSINGNGQQGIQVVNSSRLKFSDNSCQFNARNGISITTANSTVSTIGDSVVRTGGTSSFGLGWKKSDTVIINSTKYLIDSLISGDILTLQSSAGSQSGVTLQYKCFDYTLTNNDASSNNADSFTTIQNQNGIYIDAASDAGYLVRNTTVDRRPSGFKKQQYGTYIAGGSVRYWGHLAKDNVGGQFTDAVGQSLGIVDTLASLVMASAGQPGYVYGDSMWWPDTVRNALKLQAQSGTAGRGQSIIWFNNISGTNKALGAMRFGLFDASGFGKGRFSIMMRTNTADSGIYQVFGILDDGRPVIGADSGVWYTIPATRPTGSGTYFLAWEAGISTGRWLSEDSIAGGGGGSGDDVKVDTTLASGGEFDPTAPVFKVDSGLGLNRIGSTDSIKIFLKTGGILKGHFDTTSFGYVVDSLRGKTIFITPLLDATGGEVKADNISGDAIRPNTIGSTLRLQTYDSVTMKNLTNDSVFFAFKQRSPDTSEFALGDNTVLLFPPGLWEFDSIATLDAIVDTGVTKTHAYDPFPNTVPSGDSLIAVIVQRTGNYDTAFFMPFSAFGGGGGGSTRLGADSSAAQNTPLALDDTTVFLDGVGMKVNFENTGDTSTIWYDADTVVLIAYKDWVRARIGDSLALRVTKIDSAGTRTNLGTLTQNNRVWRANGTQLKITIDATTGDGTDSVTISIPNGGIGATQLANNGVISIKIPDQEIPGVKIDSTNNHAATSSFSTDTLDLKSIVRSRRSDSAVVINADSFFVRNEDADTSLAIKDSSAHTLLRPGDNTAFIATTDIFKVAGGTPDSALSTIGTVKILIEDSLDEYEDTLLSTARIEDSLDEYSTTTAMIAILADSLADIDSNNLVDVGTSLPEDVAPFTSAELAAKLSNETGTGVAVFMTALQDSSRDAAGDSANAYAGTGRRVEYAITNWSTALWNFTGAAVRQDSSWYWTNPMSVGDSTSAGYRADSVQYIWADSNINDATDTILHRGFIDLPENIYIDTLYVVAKSSDTALEFDEIKVFVDSTNASTVGGTPDLLRDITTDVDLTTTITRTAIVLSTGNTTLYSGGRLSVWMLVSTQHASAANDVLKCVRVTIKGRLRK